jgi:hypothetical protein
VSARALSLAPTRLETVLRENSRSASPACRALLLGAIIACLAASPAAAATRYVAPSGADSGNCLSAPCGSLGYAYGQSAAGDVVNVGPGSYPRQDVPSGSKAVTFRGGAGVKLRQLYSNASNVTYDGIDIDADGTNTGVSALEIHGSGQTFKNASVGNVVDTKAATIVGANHLIDNVVFHDAVYRTDGVHMECVYAIGVEGLTVRNSTFRDCAVMDLFFTYGTWWTPLPPAYGNVTLENNVFAHSEQESNGGWNYYSLYVGSVGPNAAADPLRGWVVRHNTFEQTAYIDMNQGTNGSRWVGNLGDWSCVSGVGYSHNVGKKCGPTDSAVSPASSSRTVTAALGWVNPGGYDFHLKLGSPAINAADPSDHPALDREGLVRDSRPDAGAHEYGARPPGAGGPEGGGQQVGGQRRGLRKRLVRNSGLTRHVICKRRKRCPKVTRLRISVATPSTVAVRLYRLRKGKKGPKLVRRKVVAVKAKRAIVIRSRGLRKGRYRVVAVARTKAGRKSKPQVFKLRVR